MLRFGRGERGAVGAAEVGHVEYGLCGDGLGRGERWAVWAAKDCCVEYGLDGWLGQGECLAGGLPMRAMRSTPSVVVGSGRRWAGGAAEGDRVEYGLCGGWLGQGQRKGFLFVGGKLGLDCGEGYSNCLIVDDAAGLLELLEDMLAHLFLHDDVQVDSVNVSAGQLWLPRTATRV